MLIEWSLLQIKLILSCPTFRGHVKHLLPACSYKQMLLQFSSNSSLPDKAGLPAEGLFSWPLILTQFCNSFQVSYPQCSAEDSSAPRISGKKNVFHIFRTLFFLWSGGCVALPWFLLMVKQWPNATSDSLLQNSCLISFSTSCVCAILLFPLW